MTHIRKSIRDAAVTTVTGLTTTSTRVYKGRNLPLTTSEFPCLCVYARGESYDYGEAAFSGGKAWPQRIVELHVQGYVKASDTSVIEDTLDLIAEEVETAVFAASSFGGALGMTLGEQTISVDAQGDETLGTIDMVFNVLYRTAEGAPGTAS
jgi:hypothetical protein